MKTKVFFPLAICLLLVCSWACNNKKEVAQEVKSAVVHLSDSCDFESKIIKQYRLENPIAIADIKRYEHYYKQLKDTLLTSQTDYLTLGVHVQVEELYELLCAVRSKPGGTLYVMNAIKEVDTDNGFTTESDMIFVVEHKSVSKTVVGDTIVTNVFYDFTQPCPAACPTLSNNDIIQ